MHARIENGIVVEYPIQNLAKRLTNISLPKDLTQDNRLPNGYVYVNPAPAPEYDRRTHRVQQGAPVFRDGKWYTSWELLQLSEEEAAQIQIELRNELLRTYITALTDHLDTVAKERRYDNRITCALRAGYPGPFQAEGQAFAIWMDTCNAISYQWLAEIENGTREMFASTDEFISGLPEIVWPSGE